MCILCLSEHDDKSHKKIIYSKILPSKNEIIKSKENANLFKNKINAVCIEINNIINFLNKIQIMLNFYFNITNKVINIFNLDYLNYYIIENFINANYYLSPESDVSKYLDIFIDEKEIKNKINSLIDIYNKMDEKILEQKYINLFNEKYGIKINGKENKIILDFINNDSINKPKIKIDNEGFDFFLKN